jgi:hypothetical protein
LEKRIPFALLMEVSQLRLRRNDAGTPWISRVLAWSHSYVYLKEFMGSSLHLINSRSDRDLKCELISFFLAVASFFNHFTLNFGVQNPD